VLTLLLLLPSRPLWPSSLREPCRLIPSFDATLVASSLRSPFHEMRCQWDELHQMGWACWRQACRLVRVGPRKLFALRG
jgi:hypothetical protein